MASITERKDKQGNVISYQIKVSRGRNPVTGKQLTPYTETFTPPKGWSDKAIQRALEKAKGDFESRCNRGEVLTKEERKARELERIQQVQKDQLKPTFNQYIEIYLKDKSVSNGKSTIRDYRINLRKASQTFGEIKLENITFLQVKEYITNLQVNGTNEKTGEPLAYNSINKHYVVLHTFFEHAVDNLIIDANPMQKIKRPKPRKDEIKKQAFSLSKEQAQQVLKCAELEPLKWQALINILVCSGCRRGEAVGLMWKEIDFATGKTNICRNITNIPKQGRFITSPKNGKNRDVYLSNQAISILSQWKKEQALLLFKQGISNNDFCFTTDKGAILSPNTVTNYIREFGKKYNIPNLHTHALRHTWATIALLEGNDILTVSQSLGHSKTSITLDVYGHTTTDAQRKVSEVVANAIYKNTKQA